MGSRDETGTARPLYVYGAGGFGREVAWLAERSVDPYRIVGFIDVPIVHLSVVWWRSLHQGPTLFRLGEARLSKRHRQRSFLQAEIYDMAGALDALAPAPVRAPFAGDMAEVVEELLEVEADLAALADVGGRARRMQFGHLPVELHAVERRLEGRARHAGRLRLRPDLGHRLHSHSQ